MSDQYGRNDLAGMQGVCPVMGDMHCQVTNTLDLNASPAGQPQPDTAWNFGM